MCFELNQNSSNRGYLAAVRAVLCHRGHLLQDGAQAGLGGMGDEVQGLHRDLGHTKPLRCKERGRGGEKGGERGRERAGGKGRREGRGEAEVIDLTCEELSGQLSDLHVRSLHCGEHTASTLQAKLRLGRDTLKVLDLFNPGRHIYKLIELPQKVF